MGVSLCTGSIRKEELQTVILAGEWESWEELASSSIFAI